jgi:hypothetical protein
MLLEGEKCQELLLLDGSNYESWCISILHNFKALNPSLLSIVDASICPLNINWDDFSEEEGKCLLLNAVKVYQRNAFRDHDSTGLKWCWLSDQTDQTGLAKTTAWKLQRRKRHHRPNEDSTSQTRSLPSANHGKCFMSKDKKKKKSKKVESEKEEDDECDFDFDKLSKKYMIKIKKLFKRLQEQELQLEQ